MPVSRRLQGRVESKEGEGSALSFTGTEGMNPLLVDEVQEPLGIDFTHSNPVLPHAYQRTVLRGYDEISSISGCPYARIGRTIGVIQL